MSLLVADKVGRKFGDHQALDDFSVAVAPGSIVGLIGPSGGGKTTAIRLLCGIDRPTQGTVKIFGKTAVRLGAGDRRRLALLSQDPAVVEEMTIVEQVRFAARLRSVGLDHVDSTLAHVGLAEAHDTRVSDASGGMRRRAGLAATLVGDPDLAFLDEPTAGLDPVLREEIWRWFRRRRGEGKSMVITTQHIDEAAKCDRVVVLRAGTVLLDTDPGSLARESGLGEQVVVSVAVEHREASLAALVPVVGDAVEQRNGLIVVHGDDAAALASVAADVLQSAGVPVQSIETVTPGLDEIFRAIVERS